MAASQIGKRYRIADIKVSSNWHRIKEHVVGKEGVVISAGPVWASDGEFWRCDLKINALDFSDTVKASRAWVINYRPGRDIIHISGVALEPVDVFVPDATADEAWAAFLDQDEGDMEPDVCFKAGFEAGLLAAKGQTHE